jgi:hypothetical protein
MESTQTPEATRAKQELGLTLALVPRRLGGELPADLDAL